MPGTAGSSSSTSGSLRRLSSSSRSSAERRWADFRGMEHGSLLDPSWDRVGPGISSRPLVPRLADVFDSPSARSPDPPGGSALAVENRSRSAFPGSIPLWHEMREYGAVGEDTLKRDLPKIDVELSIPLSP